MPSGIWHFALSVGVCSLVDNNNNDILFIKSFKRFESEFILWKWFKFFILFSRLQQTLLDKNVRACKFLNLRFYS